MRKTDDDENCLKLSKKTIQQREKTKKKQNKKRGGVFCE